MSGFTLVETVAVHNVLGECILWDTQSQSAWWTDIHSAVLYQYTLKSQNLQKHELPQRLCSFGFVEADSRLVCAFESGFAFYDPLSGALTWLYRPEHAYRGTRFNDGRVDRHGRFWSGTMVEGDARDAAGQPTKGSLYWISATEQRRVLSDIQISNSLCWSPDGATLYFADSPTRQIRAYAVDPDTGEPGASRVFATVTDGGAPDGSIVDADGCLWNAQWGGSKIVRYSPGGAIDSALDLPVSQPTCMCLGGPSLDLLFVSTAREDLSAESLRAQPEAGNVFIYETPYKGLPECRFRLR